MVTCEAGVAGGVVVTPSKAKPRARFSETS